MSNKDVTFHIGNTSVSCRQFKAFKRAIEHFDIYYTVSKHVFPYGIDFHIDPLLTFNGLNIKRFYYIKDKLVCVK